MLYGGFDVVGNLHFIYVAAALENMLTDKVHSNCGNYHSCDTFDYSDIRTDYERRRCPILGLCGRE